MAHIYPNEHRALIIKSRWELHVVQVSSSLAIDLSQDVGRLRKVELEAIPRGDNLRRHAVLVHDLFEHLVVVLSLQDAHHHYWVVELPTLHHE